MCLSLMVKKEKKIDYKFGENLTREYLRDYRKAGKKQTWVHKSRKERERKTSGISFSWLSISLRGISSNSHDSKVLLITSTEQSIVLKLVSVLHIIFLKAHSDFCLNKFTHLCVCAAFLFAAYCISSSSEHVQDFTQSQFKKHPLTSIL